VRPVPTLLDGVLVDSLGNTLAGVTLSLPEAGRTTVSDQTGAFSFGFGTIDQSISGGRQRLLVNASLENPRYGSFETFVPTQAGRLNSAGAVRIPWLNPGQPYRGISSGQKTSGLVNTGLALDLTAAQIFFPSGVADGVVHVDVLRNYEFGFPSQPNWAPFYSYVFSPGGIAVAGNVVVEFTLPVINGDDSYAQNIPSYLVLTALDPESLMMLPYGVGELDRATKKVTSRGIFAPERLDAIGVAVPMGRATHELMQAFARGEVGLAQLRAALAVQ